MKTSMEELTIDERVHRLELFIEEMPQMMTLRFEVLRASVEAHTTRLNGFERLVGLVQVDMRDLRNGVMTQVRLWNEELARQATQSKTFEERFDRLEQYVAAIEPRLEQLERTVAALGPGLERLEQTQAAQGEQLSAQTEQLRLMTSILTRIEDRISRA